jgi:hypothetical protein
VWGRAYSGCFTTPNTSASAPNSSNPALRRQVLSIPLKISSKTIENPQEIQHNSPVGKKKEAGHYSGLLQQHF